MAYDFDRPQQLRFRLHRIACRTPAFVALAAAGFFWLVLGPAQAQDQKLIAVDDATFTTGIAPDRQPEDRIETVATDGAPYFWTLLSANQAVLDALRTEGKLPIKHAWRRYIGSVVLEEADHGKLETDIPLDLGAPEQADKLQYEIDHSSDRVFTWRTWSHKLSLSPGAWSVFLKYADDAPVICQVVNGVGVPCVYHLQVRTP